MQESLAVSCCFCSGTCCVSEVGASIGAVNTILVMFLMMVLGVFLIKLRFRQAMDGLRNGTVDTVCFFLPLAGFLFLFHLALSQISWGFCCLFLEFRQDV